MPDFSARSFIETTSDAGPGLAHRQRADMLARNQLGEIFALLLVARPAADLVDAEIRVRAIAEADRSRRPRNFLLRDDMLEIAEAEPAKFLLDRDPVQPKLAHLRPQIAREAVLRVDLRGDRRDPVAGEAPGRFADHVRILAKVEVEPEVHEVSPVASAPSIAPKHLNKADRPAYVALQHLASEPHESQ